MDTQLQTHVSGPIKQQAHTARSLRRRALSEVASLEEAQSLLMPCETLRQPADRSWMMGRVATLLSHFYVSQTAESEMRAVMMDWHNALAEFPAWAIGEACSEWLKTMDRKPTIAGIRKLAQHHFEVVEFTRQKAMRGVPGADTRAKPEGGYHKSVDIPKADRSERSDQIGDFLKSMRANLEAEA